MRVTKHYFYCCSDTHATGKSCCFRVDGREMFIQSVGQPEYQWGQRGTGLQGFPGDRPRKGQEGHSHVGLHSRADLS